MRPSHCDDRTSTILLSDCILTSIYRTDARVLGLRSKAARIVILKRGLPAGIRSGGRCFGASSGSI